MVTATTDEIVRQLMQSPRLPQLTRQFQAILRAEQEQRQRFYDEMSDAQKTEFINGEIIVHTPVKLRHSNASDNLFALMRAYVQKHALGLVGHEKLLVTLTRNDYEPDICFFGQAKAQTFTPDQVRFPAPDLVVEILSESTEAVDRGIKFEDYALHGVAEYWIIDPTRRAPSSIFSRMNAMGWPSKSKPAPSRASLFRALTSPCAPSSTPPSSCPRCKRYYSSPTAANLSD
jgi:Uma2 family endonuclease